MMELQQRQERILEVLADLEFRASGARAPSDAPRARKLAARQEHLISQMEKLEASLGVDPSEIAVSAAPELPADASAVHTRLHGELVSRGVMDFKFHRAPPEYYSWSLEQRRVELGAVSTNQLCKSIVMENKSATDDIVDCSNPKNSRFYCIIVQYNARLDAEKVRSYVHQLNEGAVAKRRFNMQLARGEDNDRLTGYAHNAVSPVGMATDIPMIISHHIAELAHEGGFFWMG
eukprot:CAMPEP_0182881308 /NCGR_PEP_ID=MMETSP0034_2-20130328/17100_1 /TAXON_ID=156128 /ORGANISM="Nephroselmis pyriformis, Strain CCMP717" /LENGTH=232 /DNA_ID=CAMNT_0025014333 /DNA_START=78 /DNA_END=772 /DNA_ORIENTATION=+